MLKISEEDIETRISDAKKCAEKEVKSKQSITLNGRTFNRAHLREVIEEFINNKASVRELGNYRMVVLRKGISFEPYVDDRLSYYGKEEFFLSWEEADQLFTMLSDS